MFNIRITGLGGQGVVTLTELLGLAAFFNGYEARAWPAFGPERTGAPVNGFVMVDKEPILSRAQPELFDALLVLKSSLLKDINFQNNLRSTGTLLINGEPDEKMFLHKKNQIIFCPADNLAKPLGRAELANTILLGLAVKILNLGDWQALDKALAQKFSGQSLKLNRQVARLGYDQKF